MLMSKGASISEPGRLHPQSEGIAKISFNIISISNS